MEIEEKKGGGSGQNSSEGADFLILSYYACVYKKQCLLGKRCNNLYGPKAQGFIMNNEHFYFLKTGYQVKLLETVDKYFIVKFKNLIFPVTIDDFLTK
jgi:hypothetical protein